jgi:hypothetical protein
MHENISSLALGIIKMLSRKILGDPLCPPAEDRSSSLFARVDVQTLDMKLPYMKGN